MESFDGCVAVVTGAASGIGLEIAKQLAGAGAHLPLTDLNADGLVAAATDVRAEAAHSDVDTYTLDVRDPDASAAAAEHAVARFGGLPHTD